MIPATKPSDRMRDATTRSTQTPLLLLQNFLRR
jgi:hypothetical protein